MLPQLSQVAPIRTIFPCVTSLRLDDLAAQIPLNCSVFAFNDTSTQLNRRCNNSSLKRRDDHVLWLHERENAREKWESFVFISVV